jgi:hypothetical protein
VVLSNTARRRAAGPLRTQRIQSSLSTNEDLTFAALRFHHGRPTYFVLRADESQTRDRAAHFQRFADI